ncbi:hypothetical protein QE438_002241 [Pseudoxanthomonas sp. SORGH_AS 997]|nr:hypothetical protein [Pseudoxanthomonas sp. SORGH_AS_0997]
MSPDSSAAGTTWAAGSSVPSGLAQAHEHLELGLVAAGHRHDRLEQQFQRGVGQRGAGLFAGRRRRHVGGDVAGLAARGHGGVLDRLQRRIAVGEAQGQLGVTDDRAQLDGLAGAHRQRHLGQLVVQRTGEALQGLARQAAGHGQEAVVVQARQRMRRGEAGQLARGLRHQLLEGGIAVTVAQTQGAGDLDEEQAAVGVFLQRRGQLLLDVGAGVQAGLRIDVQRGLVDLGRGAGQHLHRQALAHAADAVGHRGDQVARADRLVQEVVGAAVQRVVLAFRIRIAGEEDDRQVQVLGALADGHRQRHAVLAGHVQVHQQQVRHEALDAVDDLVGLHLHFGQHARAVQHALGEQRLRAVILDDQHAIRRFGRTAFALRRAGGRGRARAAGQAGASAVIGLCFGAGGEGRHVVGPAPPVVRRRHLGAHQRARRRRGRRRGGRRCGHRAFRRD